MAAADAVLKAQRSSVCTACSMLCDDLLPWSTREEQSCAFAQKAFAAARSLALSADAWSLGQPVSRQAALIQAADWLSVSRRVLVTGLAGATLEAIGQACDLAELLGAAIDAGAAESAITAGPTVARVGAVTAGWEELRDRADLVLLWFCDPTLSHPRFSELFLLPQGSNFTRRTIAVGPDSVLGLCPTHRHCPLPSGMAVAAARALQARLTRPNAQPIPADPLSHAASMTVCVSLLVEAITAAKCVVIVTGGCTGSDLEKGHSVDPLGLKPWSVGHLVRAMAHVKQAFEIPLGPGIWASGANAAGAAAICTWRYGAAGAIARADALGSEFLPAEADAARLITRGEVDCVLAVGPLEKALEAAIAGRRESISVVRVSDRLSPQANSQPTIHLLCASTLLATSGTMIREDGRQVVIEAQPRAILSQAPAENEVASLPQMDALLAELITCVAACPNRVSDLSRITSKAGAPGRARIPAKTATAAQRLSENKTSALPAFVLTGGTIHDPANQRDGVVADIWVENGKIIVPPAESSRFTSIDATGLVVMPGGVDLHSHVAGPKVGAGRQIAPSLSRGRPAAVPTIQATGGLYASLGYTTVFDAAIATSAAAMAHRELDSLPILDKGIYLLASDDAAVLTALAANDANRVERLLAETITGCRGWAVKVANPGGSVFWKHGRRGDHHDLDAALPIGKSLTPRLILERLALAVQAIGLPHPLHVHTANLGLPGNYSTLLETMRTFDGIRAHLAHVQFHSYSGGSQDPGTFGSGVAPLVEWFNAHEELTLDVGQVLFGDTVAMTGDSAAAEHLAHATGMPWVSHDLSLEGGCGVLPISYREKSLIHAWQWAIGLEWFLTVRDPWRLVLSTDHPNGAHFCAYPLLMRLLADEPFRREAFARIHPTVRTRSPLASIRREYSLQELCIITRAAPARIAGLPQKGHLGIGADADIVLYRPDADISRMFSMPAKVFKAGVLVAENGHLRDLPRGRTLSR